MDPPADSNGSAGETPWARDPAWAGLGDAERAAAAANFRDATGGAAPHQAWQMLADLADAAGGVPCADGGAGAARVLAALEAAMALAPRDPLEGMLVAQMAAVHAAAMRCLVRGAECAGHPRIEALYLRLAARLMNLFVRQAEALDRRARRFGPGPAPCHAPPGAGPAAAARHGVGDPLPAAAPGPGKGRCDRAGKSGREPDGAERPDSLARIMTILGMDIETRRRGQEPAEAEGEAEPPAPSGAGGRNPGPAGGPEP